jgi:hypothetical protein
MIAPIMVHLLGGKERRAFATPREGTIGVTQQRTAAARGTESTGAVEHL